MSDNQPWEFTCKTYGGHSLIVTHAWNILAGADGESWQEWGPLEADHFWHYEHKEKTLKENDEVELRDFGEYAEDDFDYGSQEYKVVQQENNPEKDEFYVNCANCDREIQFGWSQPNRSGGIFPVECSDFIQGNFWLEPRYLDSRQKTGLLQNGDIQ